MTSTPTDGDTPRIHRLPTRLINQIAAGEVVTRPAAALKELIENSLDAGATRIEVAVEEGALSFSVRDDGCGLGQDDLLLAVERYATSKISEFDDLLRLKTRGFRGEALAAIAAVSRLEILTRRRGVAEGCRLKVSGGHDPQILSAGAPEGTTVSVRDLFYNTPARLKFLKNGVAEWGAMLQTVIRQSLTRPDVAFAIRWRGKPYLDLAGSQPLRERLAQVLPAGAGAELLDVAGELQGVSVRGAVSSPKATRRDRRHQFFFVNGRPIAFRPLHFAMEESYKGLVMTQQYPMGALLIEMPSETVDVNVHPTKEEVRFHNESLVTGAVHRAVAEALRAADLVPRLQVSFAIPQKTRELFQVGPAPSEPAAPEPGQPFQMTSETLPPATPPAAAGSRQLDFVAGFGLSPSPGAAAPQSQAGEASAAPEAPPKSAPQYAEPQALEEAGLIARLRAAPEPPHALAQVSDTYILAEAGPLGMMIIDQHAAHEKILYLKFLKQAEAGAAAIEVQPLLVPHSIEVAPAEAAALEGLIPALQGAGFDVAPFGGGAFLVQAIPLLFDRINVPAFLRDLIDDVGQGDLPREMRRLRERITARAACRAAVKSGDPLSHAEMQRLVDELLHTADALRCPHGRPTVMLLTREQLDRQFGRLGA